MIEQITTNDDDCTITLPPQRPLSSSTAASERGDHRYATYFYDRYLRAVHASARLQGKST